MWAAMVSQGQENITKVYTETSAGLVCHQPSQLEVMKSLESLANESKTHPAQIAEAMTVYLWNDWTLLHVEGYDTREVLSHVEDKVLVEAFLEQLYKEHQACLLGILKVLTQGYEGYYALQGHQYLRLPTPTGEPYRLLALEPKYFPGTGLLEPLGLVYAVKLGDLLAVDWLRERVVGMIAETLQRRSETSQDPLKVRH
jgi:hypothetical protein